MSRPFKITEDLKSQMLDDFLSTITKSGFRNGSVKFEKTYKWQGDGKASKALLSFDPIAYMKMLALVDQFSTEVAWHFTVERKDHEEYAVEYYITDVLVFPQYVNGGHFEQDDSKYQFWKTGQDDYNWNHLRGHGHSHATLGVTPSQQDEDYQKDMVESYDDFYVFVIWNKRGDKTIRIYDIEHNVLFENADVDLKIYNKDFDMSQFVAESKLMSAAYTSSSNKDNKVKQLPGTTQKNENKSKSKKKKKRIK